jgi:hypothetical protein
MALTAGEREAVVREFVEQAHVRPNRTATSAHDAILAAVVAIDDALDANVNTLGMAGGASLQTGLIGLLPQPFRGASTAPQKGLIYSLVFLKRAGVL